MKRRLTLLVHRCAGTRDGRPNESPRMLPAQASVLPMGGEAGRTVKGKREIAQMFKLAAKYNYTCVPESKLLLQLGKELGARMIQRSGENIYQMIAFSVTNFPRGLLEKILKEEHVVRDSASLKMWVMSTTSSLATAVAPATRLSPYIFAGSTKAFKAKTQPVIRVVAKLMPDFEISHQVLESGLEQVYVNTMYVLSTDQGELHWPKDGQRREVFVANAEEEELRREILKDIKQLGEQGQPLSPAWWRQLGDEMKAQEMEAILSSHQPCAAWKRSRAPPKRRKWRDVRRFTTESYEIDAIVAERKVAGKAKKHYLVRWAGYNPAWEVHRISGQPGDPIETWELPCVLQHTDALAAWKAQARNRQRHTC